MARPAKLRLLDRHALKPPDSNDLQRADHDRALVVWQGDNDLLAHDGGIFWVLDAKDLAAAAMYLKRTKGKILEELSYLLQHEDTLQLGPNVRKPRIEILG